MLDLEVFFQLLKTLSMKNIILLIVFFSLTFSLTFSSFAQNIYIKPMLGSQHGWSRMQGKRDLSTHKITYGYAPSYWEINLYAGLALEWQRTQKQRFELAFATHDVGYGYRFEHSYYHDINEVTIRSVHQGYGAGLVLNISLNYAQQLKEFELKSGHKIAFEGILGLSYIHEDKKSLYIASGFSSPIPQIRFQTVGLRKKYNGAGINLGFTTRVKNTQGNDMLELRFQYIQGLTTMFKEGYQYSIKQDSYYSESISKGSIMSISLGVPIRIFNLNKKQD